jgi:NAD(P)H-dependent flavin oxidoreductase YrpB (nitropropane dioxygenase family)
MSAEKRTKKKPPNKRQSKAEAAPKARKRAPKRKPRVSADSPRPSVAPEAATSKPVLHTRICEMFGVEYPIVQTGMGWVSGARLTSATSQAGGLGILAAATMTFRELREAIAKVKERTDKPFGVNLRADQADIMKRVDLLIEQKVRVASFAQAPGERVVKKLKDAGVLTMPTIGARRHAEKVQAWGVDAVIAQGQEGGGHTGQIPTSILIPDVAAAVDIPVVAAGGFRDGRGLVAAMALGAEGIAMGTRFLLTKESQVPDHVKQIYLDTKPDGTVITKAVDGYPQRVIRTHLIDQLEKASILTRFPRAALNALSLMRITGTSLPELLEEGLAMKQSQELTWSQLAMAANAPMLTKASMVDGKVEAGILPTGQVTGVIDEIPSVAELMQRIMREAGETLERLGA